MIGHSERQRGATVALDHIIGASESMRAIREKVRTVAPLDSTVLLTGETGTGKGRVARALHEFSPRRADPLVHVDCAALSPTLIESELFGHEKGAFTSAAVRHVGRFEVARNGTIFLDEIGDLEPRLQSKLLRVLDDREFERIGSTETLPMRARVISATSHDLRRAVQEGRFRVALYYRLNVFRVELPPLRERVEDVPLLVSYWIRELASRMGLPAPTPTADFHARLMQHSWRGNVRELINLLERVVACHPGEGVSRSEVEAHLEGWLFEPRGGNGNVGAPQTLPQLLEAIGDYERQEIIEALEWSGGNVTGAARRLKIPRGTLRHRIKNLDLSGESRPGPRDPARSTDGNEPARPSVRKGLPGDAVG
jgi:transcriptional regulator with GAF, ATPase, and Fis domain